MRTFLEYLNEVIKLGANFDPAKVDRSLALVKVFNSKGTKRGDGVLIRKGGATVYVSLISFAERVHISEISVMDNKKQGQGIGGQVMKMITDLADKFKVDLDLFAKPIQQAYNDSQISKEKLVKFYKKHGFTVKGGTMYRKAK